ncbi:site-specific recombinase XerD [Flavobacterium aciduliphilum]|uniref:Site-specific recombinase XerD n=1 Tax=Flavobacterium aciduliphilum TaxID=1101402 RepID=A0A328YJX8_9FLAO|nr:site-specific recombinase XerD [Flavobacterium aciduliphilum]
MNKVKLTSQGKAPIRCRITFLGTRKIFSTGLFINPKYWDSANQTAKPPNDENNHINTQLSLIKSKINQAFLFLQVQQKEFSVEDIYNQYAGVTLNIDKSLMDIFDLHIKKQEKLIGIETTKVSVAKFYQTQKHLKIFIWDKFHKKDYLLKDLKPIFISDFEYYLKAEKQFKQHTIYKTIQRFRQMIKLAVANDYIFKDPFLLHKNPKPKKEVIFLTPKELKELQEYKFASKRLEQVKDMFVFCCYTGLAYNEMAKLEDKHIEVGFDGFDWIKMIRDKTNKEIAIPLLPDAIKILNKYKNSNLKNNKLLPVISNQNFNAYIKEVAEIVGIQKNLTHHLARKTFATTILLYNDVPMEIVSELLGHSEMSITQAHYGKVVKSKVSEHMKKLSKKLNRKDKN